MLYMVIEKFKPGQKAKVYNRYRAKGRMLPEGLEYVFSWVETDGDRCFQIMQTDDDSLFKDWLENWDDLVDFEVVAVTQSPTSGC